MATGKGLGKGLSALFGEDAEGTGGVSLIKVDDIEPNPSQPRREYEPEAMAALCESIKENGVITPIAVRRTGETYQIIAGERRWRACRMAGLREMPAIVLDLGEKDAYAVSLIENLQREDLNPIEEAEGFKRLTQEFGMTQEQAAERVGKSRPAVANALRLLQLSDEIKGMVSSGRLSPGHARALLSVADLKRREELARKIAEEGLSVREAERLAAKPEKEKESREDGERIFIQDVERRMTALIGHKVTLSHGKKKGRLSIEYYGNEDLERICKLLGGGQ